MPRSHRSTPWAPRIETAPTQNVSTQETIEMYDMYPEWGPSRHRFDELAYGADEARAGVQAGLDLRDNGGQRPDDN